jgi:hypothetical protein
VTREPRDGATRRLADPLFATADALEPILRGRCACSIALAAASLVAAWHLYVPVHELLHALGCVAAGGSVTALEIQPQYGGRLLARVLPFVVAGGEYPGRLSGFDTHGSDWVYLATDALPFSLSVAIGVPLLRWCGRARRPLALGPALVLALAPFYSLPGDYFEMGSIVVTRALGPEWHALRSDDALRLVESLLDAPPEGGLAPAFAVVAASAALGTALAFASWWLGELLARAWLRPARSRSR